MADVIMPQMGESIAEGTVTKWLKNVGDRVERDEPLFEISTDKVDAEIPSPAAGILKEIRVAPGATVPINTVVAVIAAQAAREPVAPVVAPPPPPPPAPPAAAAPSSDSAAATVPPVQYVIEGEAPPPVWPPVDDTAGGYTSPPPARPRAEATAEELRLSRSSPVVRKIAAEHHVDIREIPGTGIGGRVTKQDILGHIESRSPESDPGGAPQPLATPPASGPAAQADGTGAGQDSPAQETTVPPPPPYFAPTQRLTAVPPAAVLPPLAAPPLPAAQAAAPSLVATPVSPGKGFQSDRVQVVAMSPIRRKTAEHMVLSKRTSAHVTTVFEIDMTRIAQLRDKHRASYQDRGVHLTWVPFILKAVVDSLKQFPVLNASLEGENVVYRKDVNLGLAVALDWGLIVPVIHRAEEKTVLGLARAASDLSERARSKKLKVEEVQGGTFTITNPGVFGSLFGTPIINQPQVAILDVGVIEKRPVVRDDAIAIRTMAFFALTFDHRLVDGADADRFMAHLKRSLQEFDESSL